MKELDSNKVTREIYYKSSLFLNKNPPSGN